MNAPIHKIETSDLYKNEVQKHWDNNPCGSHYVNDAAKHTLEWFLEAEHYRYCEYAPWMHETMEFARHGGEQVLEESLQHHRVHGVLTGYSQGTRRVPSAAPRPPRWKRPAS
jgi:hypothetical protein